jgi:hypothetical protein
MAHKQKGCLSYFSYRRTIELFDDDTNMTAMLKRHGIPDKTVRDATISDNETGPLHQEEGDKKTKKNTSKIN